MKFVLEEKTTAIIVRSKKYLHVVVFVRHTPYLVWEGYESR